VPFGTVVDKRGAVLSTNDTARELARKGAPHGTAVVAEEQIRGRGTKGRAWHSPPGGGLYVSFIARFPAGGPVPAFSLLPLAAGVAAADAVRASSGVDVRLRWPNDLVHDGRKLGGVLVESVSTGSEPGYAVIGVGINIGRTEEDFPEELRPRATSLRLCGGRPVDRDAIFSALCRSLDTWYNAVIRGAAADIVRAFEDRSAFPDGAPVLVTTVAGAFPGVYRGLDDRGRLLVDRGKGSQPVALDDIRGLEARG